MDYVSTTYTFDFRTTSAMQRIQEDVLNSTYRAYDPKHLKSALEDMQHVFPQRSTSGFHGAPQKRPVILTSRTARGALPCTRVYWNAHSPTSSA